MRDISYPQRTRFLPVAAFSVLLAVFAPSVFADDVRTSRAPVPFRFSEACWIWAEPKSDPPTNAYFRIVFDVTNDVRRAWFHSVLERNRGFWVNGKRVVLKSVEENRRCGGLVRAVGADRGCSRHGRRFACAFVHGSPHMAFGDD